MHATLEPIPPSVPADNASTAASASGNEPGPEAPSDEPRDDQRALARADASAATDVAPRVLEESGVQTADLEESELARRPRSGTDAEVQVDAPLERAPAKPAVQAAELGIQTSAPQSLHCLHWCKRTC